MIGTCAGRRLPRARGSRRRLEAVHFRHLHVHQHQVERLPFQSGQRLDAVVGHHDRVPLFFQQAHRQPSG